MKINEKNLEHVDIYKVLDWESSTAMKEGIISIETLRQECEKRCNWLLFYCWCYARTQGFTNKCMKSWDFGCFGNQYKTCRDGVKDALSEFIKYSNTSELAEQVEVEKLYSEIESFCRGVIWTNPTPLPAQEPVKEVPKTDEKTEPERKAEEAKVSKEQTSPTTDEKKSDFNWKRWLKIIGPVLAGGLTLGGFFLPGWAKTILDVIIKLINEIPN